MSTPTIFGSVTSILGGDTTPDPGFPGVLCWSIPESRLLQWNGSSWISAGTIRSFNQSFTSADLGASEAIELFSDDFNRPDGFLGAAWFDIGDYIRIVSNHLEDEFSNGQDAVAFYNYNWPADQWSQAEVGAATANAGPSVLVRVQNSLFTGIQTYYFVFVIGPLGPGSQLTLYKVANSVYTQLYIDTVEVNVGDLLRLNAQGSTLTVELNGSLVTTQTDSDINSGFAGVGIADNTPTLPSDGQVASWAGGMFSTGSLAVNHGLSNNYCSVSIYDDNNQLIPQTISTYQVETVDANNLTVTFLIPVNNTYNLTVLG